jgi:hypothetical protein
MAKESKTERAARLAPHRWKKGQPSPNPGGRPKEVLVSVPVSWASALRKVGRELNPKSKEGYSFLESAARMLWHKVANEGSVRAADFIAERTDGKVLQEIAMAVEVVAREERVAQVLDRLDALKRSEKSLPN